MKTKLKEILQGTYFEEYISDIEEMETAENVIEYLQERITENEVIYYSSAIKYLSENDASLKDSLSIASELGYTVENLNSESLATLLSQQKMNEELSELTSDIEESFIQELKESEG